MRLRRGGTWTTLVVLVFQLAAPLAMLPRACDRCPSNCPMHARGPRTDHRGCHRADGMSHAHATEAAPAGKHCLRAASCGHAPATTAPDVMRAVLPIAAAVTLQWPSERLPSARLVLIPVPGPEPPLHPPRAFAA